MVVQFSESQYRATLGALAGFMRASNTHPVGEAREFALLTSTKVERDWAQGKARMERLIDDVVGAATKPTSGSKEGDAGMLASTETGAHRNTSVGDSASASKVSKKFKVAFEETMESAYMELDRIHRVKLDSLYTTRHIKIQAPSSEITKDKIPKPQLAFDKPVDNSDTPFIPPHTEKHVPHTEDHPMEQKIVEATEEAKKYPITTPVVFGALDDNYPFLWVDTTAALSTMKSELARESILAVDLEHHSKRSFMGLTCLIQISTRSKDYIIDTLTLRSYVHDALAPFFHNTGVVKVFHGAVSDVTWLERDFGLYVVNLFDTYCACKALNLPGESLAHLLLHFCDIPSSNKKSMQMEDWRKRPLTAAMLKYARSDTHYLLYIYDRLRQELSKKEGALDTALVNSAKHSRFRFVKQTVKPRYSINAALKRGLDNRRIHVLFNIHMWRDQIAREYDESTGYVLSNERCLRIAAAMPDNEKKLRLAMSPWQLNPFLAQPQVTKALLDVVKQAQNDPLNSDWEVELTLIRQRKKERALRAVAAKEAAAANAQADAEGNSRATDATQEDDTSSSSTTTIDTPTPAIDALFNARRTAFRLAAKKKSDALCLDSESESSSLGSVAERVLLDATKQTLRPTTVLAAKKPSFKFGDSDAESSSDAVAGSSQVMIETSNIHPIAAGSSALFELSDSDVDNVHPSSAFVSNADGEDSRLVTRTDSGTVGKSIVSRSEEQTAYNSLGAFNQDAVSNTTRATKVPTISKSVFDLDDSDDDSISKSATAAEKVRYDIAIEARTSAQGTNFTLPDTEDSGTEADEEEEKSEPVKEEEEEEEEAKPLVERSTIRRPKQKKIGKVDAPALPPFDYAAAAAEDAKAKQSKKTEKPFKPRRVVDKGVRVRKTRKNPASGSRSMTFASNS